MNSVCCLMSSSAFDPRYGAEAHAYSEPASPLPEVDSQYRALLEEVLEQTLASQALRQNLSNDLRVLYDVADRHRGQPFALYPIGVELVQAILRAPFRKLFSAEESLNAIAAQVARTLCEHPPSCARLESLWQRLGEARGE